MDIRVEKDASLGMNYFDTYARTQLQKLFEHYSFIQSIKVFFRGNKHDEKKIKLYARLKGKDVFVKASGSKHDIAFDNAADKLRLQVEKYKSKHYKS